MDLYQLRDIITQSARIVDIPIKSFYQQVSGIDQPWLIEISLISIFTVMISDRGIAVRLLCTVGNLFDWNIFA